MRPKPIAFNPALEPIARGLPTAIAESVGRTVARHSYLEWVLGQVLYSLLEISIKQGRKVVQRPEARQYVAAVQGLFAFHKLQADFNFSRLCRQIEAADHTRDALVHSVFMRDVNEKASKVYLVRGSWAVGLEEDVDSRDLWPRAPLLDRVLLARLRKDVEDAIAGAEKLQKLTNKVLRKLHDARRTNPRLNRRRGERK